nr:cytochrome P450 81E8-like [Tanacetum cinerariifolium]
MEGEETKRTLRDPKRMKRIGPCFAESVAKLEPRILPASKLGRLANMMSFLVKHSSDMEGEETKRTLRDPKRMKRIGPCFAESVAKVLMISGKRYFGEDMEEEGKLFKEMVKETFLVGGASNIRDHLPFLSWFGVKGLENKLIALHKKRNYFFQGLIDQLRMHQGKPNFEMDLFSLIRAPNPTNVKTGSRPRAPHELPLLTLTAPRVIEMDEPAAATDSSGVPSAIERSPLDFADEAEASGRETAAPEMSPPEEVPITTAPGAGQAAEAVVAEPPAVRESRKRGPEGTDANAPPKSLRRDHADRPSGVPADVSDPDPLAFADAPSPPPADVAQSSQGIAVAEDPRSENASSFAKDGSPGSVYRPEWGVTNGSLLDTPEACQDLVDHAAPPGYFTELRYMPNDEFLRQYNINLARQVAMGSQLRLRFEQEAKLLKKSVAQVARREKRIQARELEIKNLEVLLETEAGIKRAAEEKSAGLSQELERMRAQFSELQMSNERLSQKVDALQQQVSGEESLKAAFEDYKRQQYHMVEQRCAEMDARLDAMSIDFDEELYPHMLTAIAGRRWVIGYGLRLVTMKCAESLEMRQAFADVVSAGIAKGMSEGLKHGVEHGHAQRTIESLEAYDQEAEAKFAAALQSLKDLKLLLLDQLEGLKDAPMDVIMASLYLEDDTGGDAPQFILCRTHGVGSAHHARSDRVSVSAPIVVPQGLALLLVDAGTQTDPDDA